MCFSGLDVGEKCTINFSCLIDGRGGLTIRNNVNISHGVKIFTMGHDINDPYAGTQARSVEICDNVWIFPDVLIMPGVTLREGSVIYPGAVVSRSTEAFGIYAGNPAKLAGLRNLEIKYSAEFPVWFGV